MDSFEFVDHLDFVLTPFTYNPRERNQANYSFRYLEGFIELEWFDNTPEQMLAHFMPWPRADRDFTNMDAFFEGDDPEYVDVADFYDDDVQILWTSIVAYLQLLGGLGIKQEFITSAKLKSLMAVHLGDKYPNIGNGITRVIDSLLNSSGHSGEVAPIINELGFR